MPAGSSDLELLRRFEPIRIYTRGEQFFPTDVDSYVRQCSFWEQAPDGSEQRLLRPGQVTLEELARSRPSPFHTIHFLRFIEPLNLPEAARALAAQRRLRSRHGGSFHAGLGRLARGGFLPRLLDALFSLSFLLRGKVPSATAAAAELAYDRHLHQDRHYVYYGRVTRRSGWTVLQYWFFYYYDSWRSGFHGVNDHEADWETIAVYLYEKDGCLTPEWAGYAAHDFKGDDLRRRWDDEGELEVVDGHPVVYAGAGSHASYFRPGEYQATVSLPSPGWLMNLLAFWNHLWTGFLGQPAVDPFRIPFVDYARGDGLRIGPQDWSPVVISEATPWVSQYRGLWGLFARDPMSGENAPAGPMYNRDGSPRAAWYDPLSFVGLDKVPPPTQAQAMLEADEAELTARQGELEKLIQEKTSSLQALGVRLLSLEGAPHLVKQFAALEKKISALSEEARGLHREQYENTAVLKGLTARLEALRSGVRDDPRSHIRHLNAPVQAAARFGTADEHWAAISLSLLLLAIAALVFFAPHYFWAGLGVVLILFLVIESILRGAFTDTVARLSLLLALVAALILLFHFWKFIIIGLLVILAAYLLIERLRELTG
jgi:hypothetical protein